MGQFRVVVWGKNIEISTYRKSKSVWIASGDYMGKHHSSQDRSEGAAVKRWREWAQYYGNDPPPEA